LVGLSVIGMGVGVGLKVGRGEIVGDGGTIILTGEQVVG
jgi:hypothetical protein